MPNNSPLSVEYTTCLKTSKNGMPCSIYVPIYFHPGLSYTLFKMKYWLCYSGIVSLIDEAMFDNTFDSKFDIWSDGLVVKSLDFQPGPQVQNHWAAPRPTQPFILPRSIKWVTGISGNLMVKSKLPPRSGSSLEAVEPHP